jgi:hypothetical protein
MCQLVDCKNYERRLLTHLHEVDFTYTIPMDGNRAEDGINLRYRFGRECGYDDAMIATYLDDRPCSVLEMMVALALRCEEHIMDDPDVGDQTARWFWIMVDSLGLNSMTGNRYNKRYVDTTIDIFLNREYKPNGEGGLFTVNRGDRDMRSIEIWYQMCWYLENMLNA